MEQMDQAVRMEQVDQTGLQVLTVRADRMEQAVPTVQVVYQE
jgi:hypothetical protein